MALSTNGIVMGKDSISIIRTMYDNQSSYESATTDVLFLKKMVKLQTQVKEKIDVLKKKININYGAKCISNDQTNENVSEISAISTEISVLSKIYKDVDKYLVLAHNIYRSNDKNIIMFNLKHESHFIRCMCTNIIKRML